MHDHVFLPKQAHHDRSWHWQQQQNHWAIDEKQEVIDIVRLSTACAGPGLSYRRLQHQVSILIVSLASPVPLRGVYDDVDVCMLEEMQAVGIRHIIWYKSYKVGTASETAGTRRNVVYSDLGHLVTCLRMSGLIYSISNLFDSKTCHLYSRKSILRYRCSRQRRFASLLSVLMLCWLLSPSFSER